MIRDLADQVGRSDEQVNNRLDKMEARFNRMDARSERMEQLVLARLATAKNDTASWATCYKDL